MPHTVPARLIIGDPEQTLQHVSTELQLLWCTDPAQTEPGKANPDCFCGPCRRIKQHQHASLVWINPEKDYTIDDIEIVFDKIRFALDEGETFVFVFQRAQALTPATANRLLKVFEEPPQGYRFYLLADNDQSILPTIKSRCMTTYVNIDASTARLHPILMLFTHAQGQRDPFIFEQELKKHALDDTKSTDLAHELLQLVNAAYKDAYLAGDEQSLQLATRQQAFLHTKLKRPPQSGSSDIFWKSLWLGWPQ